MAGRPPSETFLTHYRPFHHPLRGVVFKHRPLTPLAFEVWMPGPCIVLSLVEMSEENEVGALPEVDVLVVDDNDAVRQSGAEILRLAGLSVAEAVDGQDAVEILTAVQPRVIVLDLLMPRRDGYSVIAAVDGSTPIIVVSAVDVDDDSRRRMGGRVWEYLRKPVSPVVLTNRVLAACLATA